MPFSSDEPRPPVGEETELPGYRPISMAAIGEAPENGYAERLMRTIKEEAVTLHD